MLFNRVIQQTLRSGVRNQSTVSRATDAVQGVVSKVTGYANGAIYWGKVTGELAKQVYLKEKLSPPSISEFQSVYESLYKQALQYSTKPFEVLSVLKSFGKKDYILYGSYLIQFSGLFALGEAIGRFQLVGYPSYGHKSESHH